MTETTDAGHTAGTIVPVAGWYAPGLPVQGNLAQWFNADRAFPQTPPPYRAWYLDGAQPPTQPPADPV